LHSYLLEDQNRFFRPQNLTEDDQKLPPVGDDYYATIATADHAIKCLKDHAANHKDQPFFEYLAFTAPHFPLQALPDDIARYRERYRAGWDAIRKTRHARLKELGIVSCELSPLEPEVGPPYAFPEAIKTLGPGEVNRPLPWTELTPQQQEFQATKMAIHAAMIDRMDREIGRVLDQIRAMGAFENTLVMFLSDNGASAEIMVRGDGHDPAAPPGSAATHLCLGPGFSSAANTPFRRHKTWVHEGGIATPLVVHWPRGIAAQNQLRTNPGHVIDVVPTILEVAGGRPPETREGQPAPPPPGKSLVGVFAQDNSVQREYLWWLHEGNRALRVGDYKLVAARDQPWELYDLAADRSESHNLASSLPAKVRELEKLWTDRLDEFSALAQRDAPPAEPAGNKGKRKAKSD
jgi:arylsulfatase